MTIIKEEIFQKQRRKYFLAISKKLGEKFGRLVYRRLVVVDPRCGPDAGYTVLERTYPSFSFTSATRKQLKLRAGKHLVLLMHR